MTTPIKASLIALLDCINRSDGEGTLREMKRLEELAAAHRGDLHPQLSHFLERRSYAKALQFLDEGSAPAGACAPRKGA